MATRGVNYTKKFDTPVLVTQSIIPDRVKLYQKFDEIFESKHLTNFGEKMHELEERLEEYLKAPYLSLFNNGTSALMVAAKTLRLSGKVITTPFTFAATANSLAWCNITPVFADVEDEFLNLDCSKLEDYIDGETSAIMPVHVFGHPCDVDSLDRIASKHNLKLLYDAAHAFGVEVNGKPVSAFGDAVMYSFHATKIFHTIEGGGVAFRNKENKERADMLCNFGLTSSGKVLEAGLNAKINELQAAVGLVVFDMFEEEIQNRKINTGLYNKILSNVEGIRLFKEMPGVKYNYPYYVIRVTDKFGISRDELFEKLKQRNIFARKYFYPLCSSFNCFRNSNMDSLPVASKAASEVLALPLYGKLKADEIEMICDILKEIQSDEGISR